LFAGAGGIAGDGAGVITGRDTRAATDAKSDETAGGAGGRLGNEVMGEYGRWNPGGNIAVGIWSEEGNCNGMGREGNGGSDEGICRGSI